MMNDSISVVIEQEGKKYIGFATLHDAVLVDVDFYCRDCRVEELVYLGSVRDKKIPFSFKGITSYANRIVENNSNKFIVTCDEYVSDKSNKTKLANVIENVYITTYSNACGDGWRSAGSDIEMRIDFTEDFYNNHLSTEVKDVKLHGEFECYALFLTGENSH